MMKPWIIAKLIKMYGSLCDKCRQHTAREVQVGRSIVLEDLCSECRVKARPTLEDLQKQLG